MWVFVIVFIISSLKLENILGENVLTKLLPILTLSMGIARFSFFKKGHIYVGKIVNQMPYLTFALFIMALVMGFIRTHLPTATFIGIVNASLRPILVVWFVYVSISYFIQKERKVEATLNKITGIIIFTISLLAFLNLMSFLLNFGSGSAESSNTHEAPVFLAMIGIHINKVEFPLTGGHPNGVGMFAGAVLVMSIAYYMWTKGKAKRPLLQLLNIGMLVAVLLIADSRATIGNSIITVAVIYFFDRIKRLGMLRYIVLVVPFFPFIMLSTLAMLANLSFVADLSRGENDLATGNSRSIIWENCLEEFYDPQLEHIIGYGEWGTHPAGAYLNYLDIFDEDLDREKLYQYSIAHNAFFQAMFDIGLIGTFLFYAVLYLAMKQTYFLHKNGISSGIILMHFVLYFLLSGITESAFGRYNLTLFVVFLVTIATIVAFENEYLKSKIEQARKHESSDLQL